MEPLATISKQFETAFNQAANNFASVKSELKQTKTELEQTKAALAQVKKESLENAIVALKLQIKQREENIEEAKNGLEHLWEPSSEACQGLAVGGPDKIKEQKCQIPFSSCFRSHYAAVTESVIRWEREEREAVDEIRRFEQQLQTSRKVVEGQSP